MIDIDWNAPKTPCQNDWCDRPNYHVCIKPGAPDLFPILLGDEPKKRKHRRGQKTSERSEEHKAAISASQIARWERIREQNRQRDAEMIESYNAGNSLRKIAELFDVSKEVVVRVVNDAAEAGVLNKRPSQFKLDMAARDEKIIETYKSGVEVPALVKQFGISRSVIQRVLYTARANGNLRIRPRWDSSAQAERNKKIIDLRAEGYSYLQIGRLFDISKASVVAIVGNAKQ